MTQTLNQNALPDPAMQPDYYSGVGVKRLLAWVADIVVIGILTAIIATLPLFIGWFFFVPIFLIVSFIYRTLTIGSKSATWGMRLFNIELRRNADAQPLDTGEAALHTLGFLTIFAFMLPQVASVVLICVTDRGHGLHDMLTGVTMINRPSHY